MPKARLIKIFVYYFFANKSSEVVLCTAHRSLSVAEVPGGGAEDYFTTFSLLLPGLAAIIPY